MIVATQAGNVNTGAFDPVGEIADALAAHPNSWLHVDGAFGLWAAASRELRHLVRGVERADSWSTDAHKWLNVGYDCGFVAVRDQEAHRAAMSATAAYLMRSEQREYVGVGARQLTQGARIPALRRDPLARQGGSRGAGRPLLRAGATDRRPAQRRGGRRGPQRRRPEPGTRALRRRRSHPPRSSPAYRKTARHGWAERRGREWPRCASASATGRPPRRMPTGRWMRSCAAPRAPEAGSADA